MNLKLIWLSLVLTLFSHGVTADVQDLFPDLAESKDISNSTDLGIDSSKLTLTQDSQLTVYFIDEGAGYLNSFGWYDAALDPTVSSNRNMIWENASAMGSGGKLSVGSSVDLGQFVADTTLGFFLVANGYNNPNGNIFYTDDGFNSDGISHVVAGLLPDEGLLAIGFEDLLWGGDLDYNDLIIAIDIGVVNAQAIAAAAPEPEMLLMLLVGLITVYFKGRRAR